MGSQDGAALRAPRLSRALAGLIALVTAVGLVTATEAGAAGTTCSATALRVGGVSTAPANAAGRPCRSAEAGAKRTFGGTDTIRLLGADTAANRSNGSSSSDVIHLADAGLSGPTVARVLGSDAYVSCRNGKPAIVGGSSPASVDTTAQTGSLYLAPNPVTVPGLVYLNETKRGANSATYRALRIGPENGGIVAGESSAGYTGNPC